MMTAQLRSKMRFYFCPEERDGAPKDSELGVIAQHPFLGTSVDSVCGKGEAELLCERCLPELAVMLNCYGKLTLTQRETKEKKPNKNPYQTIY